MDNFRVLLIDDEEELVSTLAERLDYRGISADYAISGDMALEKLQESSYDIVLIDLKLPGLSGDELLTVIHKSYPNLPALMITGHGSGEAGDFVKPEGAYSLLQKPINISALIEKMKEAIEANEPG
ncbi:MAG: response regulator [FCB group bacterium]|nr:response regulator [FCB group bacterium]